MANSITLNLTQSMQPVQTDFSQRAFTVKMNAVYNTVTQTFDFNPSDFNPSDFSTT